MWEHHACCQVNRALDPRSESLGFDSQRWSCVEVSGKLRTLYCLSPPNRNGYLVHRPKVRSIVASCRMANCQGVNVNGWLIILIYAQTLQWTLLPLPLPHSKPWWDHDFVVTYFHHRVQDVLFHVLGCRIIILIKATQVLVSYYPWEFNRRTSVTNLVMMYNTRKWKCWPCASVCSNNGM